MELTVEKSSYISMCMSCEQTFYDEHIYKVHACYPIDSMVEIKKEKTEENTKIFEEDLERFKGDTERYEGDIERFEGNTNRFEEKDNSDSELVIADDSMDIDIKEEYIENENFEEDTSESDLMIANVQSLQKIGHDLGKFNLRCIKYSTIFAATLFGNFGILIY